MDKKEEQLRNNEIVVSIALFVVVIGLFLISRDYLITKKNIVYENVGFQIYDEDTLNNLDSIDDTENEKKEDPSTKPEEKPEPDVPNQGQVPSKQDPKYNYIGTLEINKIKLKKGFVSPSSKYNKIDYNVTIIDGYDFPDVKNGNFILAAHSGTGPQSFFKNLYKLGVGDEAVVNYKNKKYTYKIVKIYTQKKQGFLTVYRNVNKTTLTLITCTKDNKKLQTVYIAELK